MSVADLAAVLDWAAAEGWNPGLDDDAAFHAADSQGFFLAEDNGAPVAAISVVNHSDSFAFLGLYLCRPSHRGRGIGLALWQHALAHAGDRTVGLDGVPDQQANYVRSGFDHAGGTTRYSGRIAPAVGRGIHAVQDADIARLVEQEAQASGWRKPAYLSAWFKDADTRKTFVTEDGKGLVTVRKCRESAKVGPLVAQDKAIALALLRHAASVFGEDLIVDVPEQSKQLDGLCRALDMTPGFTTARMYRGPFPHANADWYAVASLELG